VTGSLPSMPPGLEHSWRNLTDLIDATAHRQVVPCRNGRNVPHAYWTSDSLSERNIAAKACGPCAAITQCAAYGIANPKESGVYGGLTEGQREQAAKETRNQRSQA